MEYGLIIEVAKAEVCRVGYVFPTRFLIVHYQHTSRGGAESRMPLQ